MEGLTAIVMLLGVIGIITQPPRRGLVVYLVVILLYPDFLRITAGTIDINPHRILITLLLAMSLSRPSIRRQFHWNGLDTTVIAAAVVYATTLFFTTPFGDWFQSRGGDVMDTLFVYFVFRLLVTDRPALVSIVKTIGVLVVPLALLSMYESLTGWNPYITLANYSRYAPHNLVQELRHGFRRAGGPWVSSIMFGLLFVSFIPLLRMLRLEPMPWRKLSYLLCALAIAGMFATLSSGPYMMVIVVVFCLWLERHKKLVKPVLITFIVGSLLVEVVSNRHFYDVLADQLAMDSANAWYRSQLIRFAYARLGEYWLVGYGFADPGWGWYIDERATDVCNDYVAHAASFGIPGLLAFCAILVVAMRTNIIAYRRAADPYIRTYAWALAAIMIGLMMAFFTVSPFKIMVTMFYIVLGLQGALPCFHAKACTVEARTKQRTRGLPLRARLNRRTNRRSAAAQASVLGVR